ncbi:unnamed protein product, partial [Heterotrigona itama]
PNSDTNNVHPSSSFVTIEGLKVKVKAPSEVSSTYLSLQMR